MIPLRTRSVKTLHLKLHIWEQPVYKYGRSHKGSDVQGCTTGCKGVCFWHS